MPLNIKKLILTAILACLAGIWVPVNAALGVSDANFLQPQGLNQAGIYDLRQIEPNLTGQGIKFSLVCRSITYTDEEPQNDYQPGISHKCFAGGQFNFHDANGKEPGISSHSTAICSILFGQDPNGRNEELGQFQYEGIAPAAKADVYEFWHFLMDNVFANVPPDADVLTTDIGNLSNDWWTRGIDSMAEQYGLVAVAGIGNGEDAFDPPLYPGAGANIIGVGVVDSMDTNNIATKLGDFSLARPEHSSFGPTDDMRCKPDIVAPGNCLVADVNDPNHYVPSGNWSSFATPVVAGAAGLLIQKAKEDPNLGMAISAQGGNCVIKAILMNSATKLPYWHKGLIGKDDDHTVPLDYIQGAGMLNAVSAYRHLIAGQNKATETGEVSPIGWDNNVLERDGRIENFYKFNIAEPANKSITATIAWNKRYNDVYPFESLPKEDGNLRLEIWAVDSNDPNKDYLLDYSDSKVDNVEHIFRTADPNFKMYEIIVSYSDINDANRIPASQRYGIAWNVEEIQDSNKNSWFDLNGDGLTDKLDLVVMFENVAAAIRTPGRYLIGDITNDGQIDVSDFKLLMSRINFKAD